LSEHLYDAFKNSENKSYVIRISKLNLNKVENRRDVKTIQKQRFKTDFNLLQCKVVNLDRREVVNFMVHAVILSINPLCNEH